MAPQALAKRRRRRLCAPARRSLICGRNPEHGQEVVDELQAMNGDALFVKTDVSKAAEVESLIATTIATYGRLDYAANIAGIGAYAITGSGKETSKISDKRSKPWIKMVFLLSRKRLSFCDAYGRGRYG